MNKKLVQIVFGLGVLLFVALIGYFCIRSTERKDALLAAENAQARFELMQVRYFQRKIIESKGIDECISIADYVLPEAGWKGWIRIEMDMEAASAFFAACRKRAGVGNHPNNRFVDKAPAPMGTNRIKGWEQVGNLNTGWVYLYIYDLHPQTEHPLHIYYDPAIKIMYIEAMDAQPSPRK